jgi:histidinol-phosphate aminotransferase
MASAITARTRLIFVCNPNNPTGTVVAESDLVSFLDQVPPEILVVLDEAYVEFATPDRVPDSVGLLARYPNLIVLRTFSKVYGLAALRIGYGIAADPAVAAAAIATQAPFAVTTVAQAAAAASLEEPAEQQLHARVAEVRAERRRVTAGLRTLGYQLPDSEANFVWLDAGINDLDPMAFTAHCEGHGVIVRPLGTDGVRISVGSPADNDALLAAVPQR